MDAVEQFPDAGSNPSAEEHLQEKNISETDLSTRHVIQDTAISGKVLVAICLRYIPL